MIGYVKRLWGAAPFATTILALALAATLVFGLRSALFWAHRHDRIAQEQPVAAWMTPGYIAHSWHVPREVVLEALDAPVPPPRGPMNLTELAALNGTSVDALIAEAETAIATWRAANPPPGGDRPSDDAAPPSGGVAPAPEGDAE